MKQQAILVIMAFDSKLVPVFDSSESGHSIVECLEKAELIRQLSGVKRIECVIEMCLTGSAYAVYQQLKACGF